MNSFCVEGTNTNPKCYKIETYDFSSEEQIFDILLDLLKSELPGRMQKVLDCNNKPMYIAEDDIDLVPSEHPAHFELMMNPVSDVPKYAESLTYRTVTYTFELILTVENKNVKCVTWELLRFKNAIEGLIIAAQFEIDGYNSVDIEPEGFRYLIPQTDGGLFQRQGAYRFSVTASQYRT